LLIGLIGLATVAPASAGAPRRAGLVVWPARTTVVAGTGATLHVANHTHASVSLTVRVVGLALDLRGAPRVVAASAGTRSLVVNARRLVVRAGAVGTVRVRARAAAGESPGDRPALVLLSARSGGGAGIGVQVRIGIPVEVRLPGLVRRRLELGALHVRGRRLELTVRNVGNLAERLARGVVVAEVWRGRHQLATLQPKARDLLPGARGVVEFPFSRQLHGRARLVVRALGIGGGRRAFSVAF
jgi:hypothetical protein